jgi:guanylate kinase
VDKLVVLSGPSGCGKTTIAREIIRRHPQIIFSVSATTRPRRMMEMHGKDYFFLTRDEFEEKLRRDELVEWQEIYGDYYGSLKSEVDRAEREERPILFDIDVKGALSIKSRYPDQSALIFIAPPSFEVLAARLRNRNTESEETFQRRIDRVQMELGMSGQFDYVVVNDVLLQAVNQVDSIITRAAGEGVSNSFTKG